MVSWKYKLGDVVKVTSKCTSYQTVISYGVVVRQPIETHDRHEYRVRLCTHSFTDYIELGCLEHEMAGPSGR